VILGVDIRRSRAATFGANHESALALCKDIRSLRAVEVADLIGVGPGELDIMVGGPPCQGFSSLRPFRSINDDDVRNSLLEHFLAFANFFRPRFIVFENVVGILHHHRGETMRLLMEALGSIGYSSEVSVLNAVHYGVPEKRERVFVIGRRGTARPSVPEPTHAYNGRSMAGSQTSTPLPLFSMHLEPALTVHDAISDLPPLEAGETRTDYLAVEPTLYQRARRNVASVLTLHSATAHTPRMIEIIRRAGANRWALPDGLTSSGFSSCYSRLQADEPSTTLTVNFVHPASNRCIHPTQDRALTPREGARIQSFDDDYVFHGNRSEVVRQIGEAIPPLLGRAIGKAILRES